jgi:hypothetical protein
MRRLLPLLALSATVGFSGLALAGEPGQLGTARLILQINASSPRTGTAAKPRPVGVEFSTIVYTTDGQRPSNAVKSNRIRLTGFRINPSAFAKCLESTLEKQGPSGCPRKSKVGTGTGTADARPAVATPVNAKVQIFNGTLDIDANGKPRKPVPALLIYADAGGGIKTYLPAPYLGRDTVETDPGNPPTPGQQPLFSIVALHLIVPPKTTKVGRRTVAFIEAPRTCPRGVWRYTQTNTYWSGERVSFFDTQPCTR